MRFLGGFNLTLQVVNIQNPHFYHFKARLHSCDTLLRIKKYTLS